MGRILMIALLFLGSFADIETIVCGQALAGSTLGATNVTGWQAGDVVYRFLLDTTANVTFDACGSSYDTVFHLYSDDQFSTLLIENDDYCSLSSFMARFLTPGEYYLVVDGYDQSEGDYVFTVTCDARPYESISCGGMYNASNYDAYNNFGFSSGDVLYSFDLYETQNVSISACESEFDSVLRLFDVNWLEIASNDDYDGCGLGSILNVFLPQGTYFLLVEGYDAVVGTFPFDVTCNNQELFVSVQPIRCGSFATGNTENGLIPYYTLSVPFASSLQLDTCLSDYDTIMRVYMNDMELIAENDDSFMCGRGSSLSIFVEAGNYTITIEGFDDAMGNYNLSVLCSDAQDIPGDCMSEQYHSCPPLSSPNQGRWSNGQCCSSYDDCCSVEVGPVIGIVISGVVGIAAIFYLCVRCDKKKLFLRRQPSVVQAQELVVVGGAPTTVVAVVHVPNAATTVSKV